MQFRLVALITLWTFLTGPIFGPPASAPAPRKERTLSVAPKAPEVEKDTGRR
jgi:hypothetical protein